jgi:HEAT repeat protein
LLKLFGTIFLLLPLILAQRSLCAESHEGLVVWWGVDVARHSAHSGHTNGVIESGNEILSNVVAVAAGHLQGLALKSDGAVLSFGLNIFGGNSVPPGLSNVVSIAAEGSSCWAIKRDGAVSRWGNGDQDDANIVAGLSNVTAIAWGGDKNYLALKDDGTVLGFRLDDQPGVRQVKVHGQVLNNVVALAPMGFTPLVLKSNGAVFSLGYQTPGVPPSEPRIEVHDHVVYEYLGGESARLPYEYTTADPVMIGGQPLDNVIALACSAGGCALALKRDGTVVAWGPDYDGLTEPPAGLTNVIAIAPGLALKRDGTVVAWGNNLFGQTSVPDGLSNVVAIAAGGDFNLALTTGSVPSSVFIQPHGRLEEMEREADLIFKGRVISSSAVTNASFPSWGKPHATRFSLISVLKGNAHTNEPIFWHITHGPDDWGGGSMPSWHEFEIGQSYLIFAARLDRPDYLYSVPPDATNRPDEFRQLYRDGVTRTLDARPVVNLRPKAAHWFELNLLLNDTRPSNELYAVTVLDRMSLGGEGDWRWTRSDDFKREAVLKAVLPLVTNADDQVAVSAIGCFQIGGSHGMLIPGYGWMPNVCGCSGVEPEAIVRVSPYSNALVAVANASSSSLSRVAAIAALSCTRFAAVSNSLPQWLGDADANVRAQAVLLLPEFPGESCARALRERAADVSPVVRAAVADAIGNGKFEIMLPTLEALFSTSPSRTNSGPWPHKGLQGDGYFAEVGSDDIHTSAGYALLNFDADQVGAFLKTNLNDADFRGDFLCKLADKDARPWLKDMADFLEAWLARERQRASEWGGDPNTYKPTLSGTSFRCWNIFYDCLRNLPPDEFKGGKIDRYLDVLENAGNTGSQEPTKLYELYRMKGLEKRAIEFRKKCERTLPYDMSIYFNRVDEQFTNRSVGPDH